MLLVRSLILVALAVSVAQFGDYLTDAEAFCSFDGDCNAVTRSPYGRPLGVPLSGVGTVAFATLFVLSLLPDGRAFGLLRPLALVGGVVGVTLLVIQLAVLGKVCLMCLVVDASSIALALVVLVRKPKPAPPERVKLAAWSVVGAAAILGPTAWSLSELPPPVPDEVKAHWEPGRVTIVEVTDFDCPYCRAADAIVHDALTRHDVKFVRLPGAMKQHENARPAARAYLAAKLQGKGEEMAAALFAADVRSPARCRELAAGLGLNMVDYDRVVNDPATERQIDDTVRWAKTVTPGLPLLYVQDVAIPRTPSPEELDRTIRRVSRFVQ